MPVSAPTGGFVSLFNGRDLTGWKVDASDPEGWSVEEGVVVARGRDYLSRNHLLSDAEFGDFVLRLEYQLEPRSQGGVGVRAEPGERLPDSDQKTPVIDHPVIKLGLHPNGNELTGVSHWVYPEINRAGHQDLVAPGGLECDGSPDGGPDDPDLGQRRGDPRRAARSGRPAPRRDPARPEPGRGPDRPPQAHRDRSVPQVEVRRLDGEAPPPPGFVPLFNGKDLAGWAGDRDGYEVRDGILRSRSNQRATIYGLKSYRDFAARVEFRLSPGGNSGLAIRYPGSGQPSTDGMCEIQILDDSDPRYQGIDPRQSHGSAFGLAAATRGSLRPVGQWNTQEVTVRGSTVKVELNGTVILDVDLGRVTTTMKDQPHPGKGRDSGYFGLVSQDKPVEFRKIEIREISDGGPASAPPVNLATLSPLDRPVKADFRDASFLEFLNTMREASAGPNLPTGLTFFVYPVGLQQAGQTVKARITLAAGGMPLKVALSGRPWSPSAWVTSSGTG